MASIQKEVEIAAPADAVWAVLRDFGGLLKLAPGFVTGCALEEEGTVRLVTFFNGMQLRERLVTLDDAARRIVYTAFGGSTTHHNASAQVIPLDAQRCRFVWIADLLPHAMAPAVAGMIEAGLAAMKAHAEPRSSL